MLILKIDTKYKILEYKIRTNVCLGIGFVIFTVVKYLLAEIFTEWMDI